MSSMAASLGLDTQPVRAVCITNLGVTTFGPSAADEGLPL